MLAAAAKASQADRDLVHRLNGMFVGQLNEEELMSFQRCVADHSAWRDYSGPSGFLGLAKVRAMSHG